MSHKLHDCLTVLFRVMGGVGFVLLVAGILSLLVSFEYSSSKQWPFINNGWDMLFFGITFYGAAFTACHFLVKIENKTK